MSYAGELKSGNKFFKSMFSQSKTAYIQWWMAEVDSWLNYYAHLSNIIRTVIALNLCHMTDS